MIPWSTGGDPSAAMRTRCACSLLVAPGNFTGHYSLAQSRMASASQLPITGSLQGLGFMTAVLFCYMLLQPVFGAISDKIGRRNSMLCFGVFTVLATVPILSTLAHITDPYAAFGLVILALAGVSFYTSISGLVKAELFPMHVRALGVGLSYALANAAFGGSAEYVALWFKSIGLEPTFFWYVTAMGAIALLAAILMPETRRRGHLQEHEG